MKGPEIIQKMGRGGNDNSVFGGGVTRGSKDEFKIVGEEGFRIQNWRGRGGGGVEGLKCPPAPSTF